MVDLARHTGWIEVVCGPMFSGKTEELIRRLRRAVLARQRVQAFKPTLDRRYHATRITSHDATWLDAEAAADLAALALGVLGATEAGRLALEVLGGGPLALPRAVALASLVLTGAAGARATTG